MAISYGLRFVKQGANGKILIEKEGEMVFNRNSFRLKGKGANDLGENLQFVELREIKVEKGQFMLTTFKNEKYVLTRFGTSFEAFLDDFYKIKNEFFADSLEMKQGMLIAEFESFVEIYTSSNKHYIKGKTLIQLYEGGVVFFPKHADVFCVHLNFLTGTTLNEDAYTLEMETDSGLKIYIAKLGSGLNELDQLIQQALEKMYQKVINGLNNLFGGAFAIPVLLKIAAQMKVGKCVSLNALKKIDALLPVKVLDLLVANDNAYKDALAYLRSVDKQTEMYVGFDPSADGVKGWFLLYLRGLKLMVLGRDSAAKNSFLVFRDDISAVQDDEDAELKQRVLEINHYMTIFDFNLVNLNREKSDLIKSKLKVPALRLSFLKEFKRHFVAELNYNDSVKLHSEINVMMALLKK